MRSRRGSWSVRLVTLFAGALVACGGDDICLNCPSGTPTPGSSGVTVTGNIASSSPFTSPSSINVVICLGLDPTQGVQNCPDTFLTVPNVEGSFTRSNVDSGALSVFFWVDEDDNGMIDPDDPLAQLSDPEGQLDDVAAGQTATLGNVRIQFLDGTASATITVGQTPTPTPSAAQPIPTPTSSGS